MRIRSVDLGGLTVSALGLGCWGMSEAYGPTDWDESIATIQRAIDLGVTFLDTADVYGAGHNEVLVGRAIAGRRDQVQIATKVGIDRSMGAIALRGEPAYIKRGCEGRAGAESGPRCAAGLDDFHESRASCVGTETRLLELVDFQKPRDDPRATGPRVVEIVRCTRDPRRRRG